MLKIYRKTIINEIHRDDTRFSVSHDSFYTIEDEDYTQASIREYNLYSDEIQNVYIAPDIYDKKRGRVVYVYSDDGLLKFKQWKAPNVKLLQYIYYKEQSCSMNELFRLNADKVIAYLKQEGINLMISP